ncbi:MAG: hypothetical protein SGJ23_16260 [Alphaproteobacteria bacterium]|nr:hypothetical protein [Alphaproteobacteria bacterium]
MISAENRVTRTYAMGQYRMCHERAMQTALVRIESIEVQRAYADYRDGREAGG